MRAIGARALLDASWVALFLTFLAFSLAEIGAVVGLVTVLDIVDEDGSAYAPKRLKQTCGFNCRRMGLFVIKQDAFSFVAGA